TITDNLRLFLESQSDEKKKDPLYLGLVACVEVLAHTREQCLSVTIEDVIEKEKRERSLVIECLPESDKLFASELQTPTVSCLYYNIRSIVNKLPAFRQLLSVEQPDIICITESWLNSRTPSSLLIGNLPYTVVRRDRTRSRGGGTLLIIRDHFHFSVVQSVNDDIECLSVDLLTSSSLFIRLCIVYRPPSYSNPQTESLTDSLSDLIATSPYPVVFIGDFNSDNITSPISPIDKTLDSFVSSSGLSHLIRSPTRNNRCIDWLLTSDISCISDPIVIPAFPSSDHSGISFSIDYHCLPTPQSLVRDYARANYEDLTTYLHSFDWYDLFCSSPNSNDMYNVFTSVVHNGIDQFVPYHCMKPKIASYPSHIQNLINHRNILFAKINIPSVRRTKDLYRHIRSLTKTKSIVPKELISSSGCAVTGISNITNLLATQFASYFTLDDGCIPTIPSLPLPPFLSNVSFLPTDVFKALSSVLGPILFTLYIADISHILSPFPDVRIQSYADDIKVYISYSPNSFASRTSQLQAALNAIHEWTVANQLSLSESKCTHLHIGRSPIPSYHINNITLSQKSENAPQRDLGLQVVPSLLRTPSIDTRISKAQTALFIMLRAVSINCADILLKCFQTYVLPHLEFASPFWNPYVKKHCERLEKVQQQFTRILFYRCFPSPSYPIGLPSYPQRLSHLGLQALFERRVIFDLVFARRIMNGETILDRNKFFIFKPLRDRTNTFGVHIECTRSTPRFHCFPRRVAMLLNTLPPYIHRSPSMNVYKSRL
ncbi:hypothetical protein PFISCL1PPCAC_8636, partial [Pristionchus fissidentatus]